MNIVQIVEGAAHHVRQGAARYPVELDSAAIGRLLPHRGPIFFARRIRLLAPDRYVSHVTWTPSDMGISGHFPGRPVVPAIYLIEAAAQTAGAGAIACAAIGTSEGDDKIGVLAGVRRCMFKRPVLPDQEVVFDLTAKQGSAGAAFVTGSACVEGSEVASLDFMLVYASRAQIFG